MKKIRVTDLSTGKSEIYDYSKNNWLGIYACMHNGSVFMWAPKFETKSCVTSGRRWELLD